MARQPISAETTKQVTKRLKAGDVALTISRELKVSSAFVYKIKGELKQAALTKAANYKAAGVKAAKTRAAKTRAKTRAINKANKLDDADVISSDVKAKINAEAAISYTDTQESPVIQEINTQITLRENEITTLKNTLGILYK